MKQKRTNRTFAMATTIGLGAAAVVLIVVGGGRLDAPWGPPLLTSGIVLMGISVLAAALVLIQNNSASRRERRARSPKPRSAQSDRQILDLLAEIRDAVYLSDDARRAVFRERERQVLRAIVEDAVSIGDYGNARQLCDAIEEHLSDKDYAATLRGLIDHASESEREAEATAALGEFEAAVSGLDWRAAYREAARLRQLFPASSIVTDLDARIARARDDHKSQLEQQFLDASNRDDVETAMAILRELDRYMTREEAERLNSEAQQIITRHRERLGEMFRRAVRDRRWKDAAYAGNAIIEGYPNTKMADEVRSMIDVIRTRATQAAIVAGE